ncbi:conserved Plasmodium protein, unknown function [Plasmodium relictum]|uniref:Uncharacterized protein n=1 Tax=Plasmodium relictum TaxID=85471 RepID=A0A1J1H8X3_PLARL|nr:conserved Plasmodium protein, unknown function [Plasmodium relictum]CRH00983.1 conserved Plasmodium protein, unknown function [Plasmodium relictum]
MDNSLFTVPRYIPEVDSNINEFSKIKESENKNVINNKLYKKDNINYDNKLNKDKTNESKNLNYDKLEINEKIWFNNLIKKKDEEFEITNVEESENDDEIIINTNNIFKTIYPFFKTEEDSNYLNQKKELKKNIKNMS